MGKIAKGELIPNKVQTVDDIEIAPHILGDGAFPLCSWLMKPYGDAVLTPDKRYFNYRSSRNRMVTEGAFGKLKGRFRILHRKYESNKEAVKIMGGLACVILHNICIGKGDLVPRKFDLIYDITSHKRRESNKLRDLLDFMDFDVKNYENEPVVAVKVRDKITEVFWSEREGCRCLIKAKTQIERLVYLIDLCSLEIVFTFYYTFLFVRLSFSAMQCCPFV